MGQTLAIRVESAWKEVTIGGLIYSFQGFDGDYPIQPQPFTLIGSDALYESLVPEAKGEAYDYVGIDASAEADAITDLQVANVLGGAEGSEFANNRLGYELLVQELLVRISFTMILSGMGTALCLILFCQMQASRQREQREQWELLANLGMKKSWRRWMAAADALVPSLLVIGVVTLGLTLFYSWEHSRNTMLVGEGFHWMFLVGFDPYWYAGVCLAYLTVIFGVMQLGECGSTGNA